MTVYDITIEITRKKDYQVEAENTDEATTKALEAAIAEHPDCDVWVRGAANRPYSDRSWK